MNVGSDFFCIGKRSFLPKDPFCGLLLSTITMANHSRARIALTFVGLFTLLAVITFSSLSGFHAKLGEYF